MAEIDYVEETGPGIPELPEPTVEQPLEGEPPEPPQLWEQDTIEDLLEGLGSGLHLMLGKGPDDWEMTEVDLARIAPPLTRIANRYEPVARLAPMADPILVARGFALYGWREAIRSRNFARQAAAPAGPRYEPVIDGAEPPEEEPPIEDDETPAPYFPHSPKARQQI